MATISRTGDVTRATVANTDKVHLQLKFNSGIRRPFSVVRTRILPRAGAVSSIPNAFPLSLSPNQILINFGDPIGIKAH